MKFPYAGLPDRQIWKRAMPGPVTAAAQPRFTIDRGMRIASAGSCFAQNIAQRLQESGYNYFVTEPGPLWENSSWLRAHQYGSYSARFGDIYTTAQLAQLAQRAVGQFSPIEAPWQRNGRFTDPFRPFVEPEGFAAEDLLNEDRTRHLRAVARMLQESDVFIFTLGLTEGWYCSSDDAALPLCPGAGAGTFDPQMYYYKNAGVDETIASLQEFLDIAWTLNPGLRVIFTVSPVPLAATMEPRHIVASTMWSKSVLRVAAEEMRDRDERVDYFPAYEIVTNAGAGYTAFEPNLRPVTPAAVDRVMDVFFATFGDGSNASIGTLSSAVSTELHNDPCGEDYFVNFLDEQRDA